MPVHRSPLNLAVSGQPAFQLPNALLEVAVGQFTMTTLVDFDASTLMTYDPSTRRFIVVNPAGSASGEAYMTQSGTRWTLLGDYNTGATYPVTPYCIASDGGGTILLGGYTDLSPTKIRRTVNGGGSWQEVNIGASNADTVTGLGYSSALGLWFASTLNQGLFTSVDGTDFSWTLVSAPATYMGNMYFRNTSTPLVMFSASSGPPGSGYFTTTDGVTITARTFPVNFAYTRGCYSAYWNTFYANSATNTYTSSDAINWTLFDNYPTRLFAHEHLLLSSAGYLSPDGGYSWPSVLEVNGGSADWIGSAYGRTLFRDGDTFLTSAATRVA